MTYPKTDGPIIAPNRRGFMLGVAAAASGLAIGFRPSLATAQDADALNPLEVYVKIGSDDSVTVLSAHMDMGQGIYHGIATLVVEELGCRWDQIDVQGAAGNTKAYGNIPWGGFAQGTGGSTAMASSWERYRMAGATARAMLADAAALVWDISSETLVVEQGVVRDPATGNQLSFGELANEAATLPIPVDVTLKSPEDWQEIGVSATKRFDRASKTDGSAQFTADLQFDNMLTAVPIHPPQFGARLMAFHADEAKAMPGVVDVVPMPRGVSVVAKDTWTAIQARELVTTEWDNSDAETRGSDEILAQYRAQSEGKPTTWARADGDSTAAFYDAETTLEAIYEFPFLAHAALEPLNAVAERRDEGSVDIWGGHQAPDGYQQGIAGFLGIAPQNVRLHVMKTGGGFGRRAVPDGDIVLEAVATAQAIGWQAPVKMQWTREDDMAGGRYRPAIVHKIKAGLSNDGRLVAWDDHIVGQSINTGTPLEAALVHNGVDVTSVEGARSLPYGIPNVTIGLTTTDVAVPVLWWRSVGHTHTAFVNETFLDRLAEEAGKDPVAFRLEMLPPGSRHAVVLQEVAKISNWDQARPEGRYLGVALHESFGSVVAQVAEISVDGDGWPRVHHVWCAVDCGVAVNPDTIRAQLEGSIGFGLGAIFSEELTLSEGRVDQSNYDSYTPLRIDEMPEVTVSIVPSGNPPTGIGEPGVPPIGPAVANAYHAATGQRITTLPFTKSI